MRHAGRSAVLCAAAVLVLAGCGQRAAEARPDYTDATELPERLGTDGASIVVGDPKAEVRVQLYEDPRCPVCEEFETAGGSSSLRAAMFEHTARTEYTLASFLDDRVGGTGSKKAVNALRAALEADRFVEYHEVLYGNQPEEAVDGFTDAYLLELAGRVEGLRGPEFDAAVKTMKYRSFVTAAEAAYEKAGGAREPEGPGTPAAVINSKRIPAEYNSLLFDQGVFADLLTEVSRDPVGWQDVDFDSPVLP